MASSVPIIDIAAYRRGDDSSGIAEAIDQACREIGFLVITGHGVDGGVIADAMAAMRAFFALPPGIKGKTVSTDPALFRGWYPSETMALNASEGEVASSDLRESFVVQRVHVDAQNPYYQTELARAIYGRNLWPDKLDAPGFQDAISAYYRVMEGLAGELMTLFALALDLPGHFFADKIQHHMSNLGLFAYPPIRHEPVAGQLRGGAHTDFGSLTIVYAEPSVRGLQIRRDGEWVETPQVDGAFVVNIGDLMAQWTNDRWVSTRHRVANPPREEWQYDRYSLIFFHQPNYDAVIECLPSCVGAGSAPKYAPETSGEHLMRKLSAMAG